MKVITQLIQHFWQRDALTYDQAAYLVRQGFARASDLPGLELVDDLDDLPTVVVPMPAVPPHPLELVEEDLGAKTPARRGRAKPKGKVLTEAALAKAVAAIFADRAETLEVLRTWATAFGKADDWVDAAVAIRQATDARVFNELLKSMRKRTVSIATLWTALDVEPLHALIDSPDLRGGVPRAFRLLLTTDGPLPVAHTSLLKHAPLEAAKSLATAHRRLRTALHGVYMKHSKLMADALKTDNHPVVFWGLTVLYNARRKPLDGPTRLDREFGPVPLPAANVWRQGWATALAMDVKATTALLIACYKDERDQEKREPWACTFPFHCPLDWRLPAN